MLALAEEQQLSFFEDRLPHRPYCTEDLQYGVRIRPLKAALKLPYLQINPPH